MFDRLQTGCSSQRQIQVNSCVSQNDFPTPQHANISFINVQTFDCKLKSSVEY